MEEIIYKIALSMVNGMTAEVVRAMEEMEIGIEEFFKLDMSALAVRFGATTQARFESLNREESLFRARQEYEFISRHNIEALFLTDDNYPLLLAEAHDAPVVLYKLGDADLNRQHIINLVGTRRCTNYGIDFCKNFVKELGEYFPDLTVVSGLAYGIDAAAHSAALENHLCTVGVLAHGLDTIYPAANRNLAKEMIRCGGALLSEYPSGTTPYPKRFLERNRIVAGMSEVTIVVESEIKGGAMSTANQAFSYGHDVMALPGRVTDQKSSGTNLLIRRQKASMITCAADLIETTGWEVLGTRLEPQQRNLFPELDGDQGRIYETLRYKAEPMSLDALHTATGISLPVLISALTELEFAGVVVKMPGARYAIS
jgi:DNA processing protein